MEANNDLKTEQPIILIGDKETKKNFKISHMLRKNQFENVTVTVKTFNTMQRYLGQLADKDPHNTRIYVLFNPDEANSLATLKENLTLLSNKVNLLSNSVNLVSVVPDSKQLTNTAKEVAIEAAEFAHTQLMGFYEIERSQKSASKLIADLAHVHNDAPSDTSDEAISNASGTSDEANNASAAISKFETWTKKNCNEEDLLAVDKIIVILKSAIASTNPKSALEGNKKAITEQLELLQKSSRIKTFQNACATVVACLLSFALVGLIPIAFNHWKRGDAFLFFTQGAKQQAELAINLMKKEEHPDKSGNGPQGGL